MPIKRNSVPKLEWYGDSFADVSTLDLFSYERWGVSLDWDVLLEQAKKIDSIVLLIDKYAYGSRLFVSYIDILEANVYIFDDLFYALVGTRIGGEPDPEKFFKSETLQEISQRLFFWNLDWREDIINIYQQLIETRTHIVNLLNQRKLEDISKMIARRWNYGFYIKSDVNNLLDIIFDRDRAHQYAISAYQEDLLAKPLAKQILTILSMLDNAITVFGINYDLPDNCFPFLLEQFRGSENAQELIKAWKRDFNGSRDNLIAKMEKDLELNKWVHRYLHLQDGEEIVVKLFHDEDGCWLVDDKEYYNTKNWINILKVATLLQEYDELNKEHLVSKPSLPACLRTSEAEEVWDCLRDADFIVMNGYDLAEDISANQATYIADCLALRFDIKQKWKVFQTLWKIKNMAQLANSWKEVGRLPPKHKLIRNIILND